MINRLLVGILLVFSVMFGVVTAQDTDVDDQSEVEDVVEDVAEDIGDAVDDIEVETDIDVGDGVQVDENAAGDTVIVIDDQYYAGASFGYPGFNLHFGIDNLADSLDARATLAFNYAGSGFEIQAAGLYVLPIEFQNTLAPLDIYIGGGPVIGLGGGFTLGLNVLGGGEYRLGEVGLPEGGVFLELGPQIDFVGSSNFGYTARTGFNYHF